MKTLTDPVKGRGPNGALRPKQLTEKKVERIARRLERALKLGTQIGRICERRKKLLALSLEDGLPMNEPIRLNDGNLWSLRKPEGKFVRFEEVELKRIPTFTRTPKPDALANGGTPAGRPQPAEVVS